MNDNSNFPGPHSQIPVSNSRDRFLARLLDVLWHHYRRRVEYVQTYERIIQDAGATFVNDHIAFRTLALQRPSAGNHSVSRVFEALGYLPAGTYTFPDKMLSALHYQHPESQFPKLFISQLETWQLPSDARQLIARATVPRCDEPEVELLAALHQLHENPAGSMDAELVERVVRYFNQLPWPAPELQDVETLHRHSQYAAWVLVHGYAVNHFTSLINTHEVEALSDIEKTVNALRAAGVPMKETIEGEAGSKLRQTATEAVTIDVPMQQHGRPIEAPWTYAYFELAERGMVTDPETGRAVRFEGFLGPQATQLFEMTARKESG